MSHLSTLAGITRFLWVSTSGYRLRPWRSPYLRWRIETYGGIPADRIDGPRFWRFAWRERRQLVKFLLWAGEMSSRQRHYELGRVFPVSGPKHLKSRR